MVNQESNKLGNVLTLLLAAGGLLWAPSLAHAQGSEGPNPSMAAMGKESYRTYCASCHGATGKGDGPIAEHLKVRPADLTRIAEAHNGEFPLNRVARIIDGRESVPGHGTQEMPAWGDAFKTTDTKEQAQKRIEQLTHFLWSIQGK